MPYFEQRNGGTNFKVFLDGVVAVIVLLSEFPEFLAPAVARVRRPFRSTMTAFLKCRGLGARSCGLTAVPGPAFNC